MTAYNFVLDVPFKEKDEVKRLGARWNGKEKVWYYEGTTEDAASSFGRWTPRLYLDVPYDDKDYAKNQGAQWDLYFKKWYIEGPVLYDVDSFGDWLPPPSCPSSSHSPDRYESRVKTESPQRSIKTEAAYHSALKQSPKKAPPKKAGSGNSKDATVLRISDAMTIPQLKEECQFRGIKGFSGKTKDWLLEQLGDGSIWQSAKVKGSGAVATKQSSNATVLRINELMTLAQLKEECQFRGIKGSSGKSKDTLLELLDIGSVWQSEKAKGSSSASTLKASVPKDPTKPLPKKAAPKKANTGSAIDATTLYITDKMTIAQLKEECQFRGIKGVSGKTKDGLLEQVGIGTIWLCQKAKGNKGTTTTASKPPPSSTKSSEPVKSKSQPPTKRPGPPKSKTNPKKRSKKDNTFVEAVVKIKVSR
jgi:hypothetical protein